MVINQKRGDHIMKETIQAKEEIALNTLPSAEQSKKWLDEHFNGDTNNGNKEVVDNYIQGLTEGLFTKEDLNTYACILHFICHPHSAWGDCPVTNGIDALREGLFTLNDMKNLYLASTEYDWQRLRQTSLVMESVMQPLILTAIREQRLSVDYLISNIRIFSHSNDVFQFVARSSKTEANNRNRLFTQTQTPHFQDNSEKCTQEQKEADFTKEIESAPKSSYI